MKKNLLAALFLLLGTIVMAQTPAKFKVQGTVKDSTLREAMPYSTVLVRDSTQKYVVSTYTSDQGNFEFRLPSGTYTMIIGFTGYTPDSTVLKIGRENINYGTVYLKEGIEIGTVQILGQIVTTDIDKTTYNTAADPETPALTALEMMRKVPMLTLDAEDNIQLKGQSDYKILVNGRPSGMMSKNYKDVLKAMPASSIKSIEVITNPPARYDSEGIGGIINIITNRQVISGYNGSLGLGYGSMGYYNGSGYIAAQFGKFNISANLYGGYNDRLPSSNWSSRIDSLQTDRYRIDNAGQSKGFGHNVGGNIEASYEIDTVNLLTVGFGIGVGKGQYNGESVTEFFDRMDNPSSRYRSENRNNYNYTWLNASLSYQHTFKKPDQIFTLSYQYDGGFDNNGSTSDLINEFNYPDIYNRRMTGKATTAEHTIQADYFDPITKIHNIEAGIKYIYRPNWTDNNKEILQNQIWVPDNKLKNDMDYMQHIGSFYGGYAMKLDWLSVKAGFRGELTINDGLVKMMKEDQPKNIELFNRYFNFVPYITLNFKLNEANSIRIGYTQRLRRPMIWQLNPYLDDLNPTQLSSGNPELQSVLNHTIDLNYSIYKQKWNIGLSATYYTSSNAITYFASIVKPGDIEGDKYIGRLWNRPENIGNGQAFVFNLNAAVRLLENKLTFGANISGGYSLLEAPQVGARNEGFNYSANANASGQPWTGCNINIYYNYSSPNTQLQGKGSSYSFYGFSVNQSFLDKKLIVSLSCSNPFEEKRSYYNTSSGPGFSAYNESLEYSRSINMRVTWRFGKMDVGVKQARRGISNDDGGGSKSGGSGAGA